MDETMAVKTSGGTTARSRLTNEDPMVSRVTVSQFGSPSAPSPRASAAQPSNAPRARPMRIWTLKEGRRRRRLLPASVVAEESVVEEDTTMTFRGRCGRHVAAPTGQRSPPAGWPTARVGACDRRRGGRGGTDRSVPAGRLYSPAAVLGQRLRH